MELFLNQPVNFRNHESVRQYDSIDLRIHFPFTFDHQSMNSVITNMHLRKDNRVFCATLATAELIS